MQRRRLPILALLVSLGALRDARAEPVSRDIAAKVFFKTATYDANLPAEATFKVLVTYRQEDQAAGAAAVQLLRQFERMEVNGRRITILEHVYSALDSIEPAVIAARPYGLFVLAPTPDVDVAALRTLAQKHALMTFSEKPAHVSLGIVASVQEMGGARQILLNLKAAEQQGRRFAADFVTLCKLVQ